MLQKDKLGKKVICADCKAKYYDLNRKNSQCPKCGSTLVQTQKPVFKMSKPIEIEPEETDLIDTDDDVELLPIDTLENELSG